MNVVIAGTGNAAWHFARMTLQGGHRLAAILSRNPEISREMADEFAAPVLNYSDTIPPCDLIILAIRDNAIANVAAQMPSTALITHVSGSMDLSVIPSPRRAVMWPLQTLTRGVSLSYQAVPFCIEFTSEPDGEVLTEFLRPLQANAQRVSTEERFRIHLAAVIACNFSNLLYTIAADLLKEKGLPFKLLLPLIEETATKVQSIPPELAQTGPAVRGDSQVMHRQHAQLEDHPKWQQLYQLMSELIQSHT